MIDALSVKTISFSTSEFGIRMEQAGVPAGPVNSLAQIQADPHVLQRRMLIPMRGANEGAPDGMAVRMPVLFDGIAAEPERGAPRLGEHNAEFDVDDGWLSPPAKDN